ncbi:unnamed protein product [Protopolystoma xenopodis]|uniref:Uncharacterized protein n=1 Tax=Protopolystoma xenopodis TaxID=117903 RepID=A0A3S5ADJ7_9PLAT|nr:unnamed protein product [Protopolystoma xenopodis]
MASDLLFNVSIVSTPGQRAHQASVLVCGSLSSDEVGAAESHSTPSWIAITGGFFPDEGDASKAHIFEESLGSVSGSQVGSLSVDDHLTRVASDCTGIEVLGPPSIVGDLNLTAMEKENKHRLLRWRDSRDRLIDKAQWIIPAYGSAFRVQPEFSKTPCIELA